MRRRHCLFFGFSMAVLLGSLVQAEPASHTDLSLAMDRVKKHILGTSALRADQINQQTRIILENIDRIGATAGIISEALDLVACYESAVGPLFLNDATRGGFPRKPAGGLELASGVIRAARHVHMHPDEAAHYGVEAGDLLDLVVEGEQGGTLRDVICRISDKEKLEVHLDTDEGNAVDVVHAQKAYLTR